MPKITPKIDIKESEDFEDIDFSAFYKVSRVQSRNMWKGCSDKAFKLYCVLLSYKNIHTQRSFPSTKTIVGEMNCSLRSVQTAMYELEDRGLLYRLSGNKSVSNQYFFPKFEDPDKPMETPTYNNKKSPEDNKKDQAKFFADFDSAKIETRLRSANRSNS